MSEGAISAEGVRWDLTALVASPEEAKEAIEQGVAEARAFIERWLGRVPEISASELRQALDQQVELEERAHRAAAYAQLRGAVEMNDPEVNDLLAWLEPHLVELANVLRPFELALLDLSDERTAALAASPELADYSYMLLKERRWKPHTLSIEEESVLSERSPLLSAWQQLHRKTLGNIIAPFDAGTGDEPHTIDQLLSHMSDSDRDIRCRALTSLYEVLTPHQDTLAACYDALVGDRLMIDRLKSFGDDPMLQTHMRNDLPATVVETMLAGVADHYPLAQRWFERKATLLELPKLTLADQYAPLEEPEELSWQQAEHLMLEVFASLSPAAERHVQRFFKERLIDAEARQGKRGGAFCASISRQGGSYVMMNFNGTMKDSRTLAHELGHGLHGLLALEKQNFFSFHAGTAIAEIPSTFAELVLCGHLMKSSSQQTQRYVVQSLVEDSFATVFRQTAMARFEKGAYEARREGKSLSAERLSELWWAENVAYYGDSVELPDGYRAGWSYIPHFINSRFYTYSYAFAFLVALTLYGRYELEGQDFIAGYLEFLSRGGSASAEDLLRPLGVDLTDPAVFDLGFAQMERLVETAEQLELAAA